jgi:hypothetical protein
MSHDLFWENLVQDAFVKKAAADFASSHLASAQQEDDEAGRVASAVEHRMSGRSQDTGVFTSVRALSDVERAKVALQLPVEAGTKVAFIANAGSVLTYDSMPDPNMEGTVISVKSASGDVTSHEGKVFVRWSDGVLRGIYAEHLRPVAGTSRRSAAVEKRIRVASLGDLSDFLNTGGFMRVGNDQLVHKATQDLWSLKRDTEGFVIERLFDDVGSPLKV